MIAAYSHTVEFPFEKALEMARIAFPDLDLSTTSTPLELEKALHEAEEILYVDADFEKQSQTAIEDEKQAAIVVDAQVGVLDCPEDGVPVVYTQEELDAAVFCEVPQEYPNLEGLSYEDFAEEIDALEQELDETAAAQDEEAAKMVDCIGKMQAITDSVNNLITKETHLRETEINVEELLFNYRPMEVYYKKRVERLNQILNIFDPLIIEKRRLEAEIDRFTPIRDSDKDKYVALDKIINPNNYNGSSGASGASGTSGTSQQPNYTQQQYSSWQAAKKLYNDDEKYLTKQKNDLQKVKDRLSMEKNKISPFVDTDVTTANATQYGSNAEQQRQQFLANRLSGIQTGVDSIYSRISAFTSRTKVIQQTGSSESFSLEMTFTLLDKENILAGRPKTWLYGNADITMTPVIPGVKPSGVLYDTLYNIWDDDQKFFTREEKGLTANANDAANDLKGTGAEAYKDNFIKDVSKFREFYENFPQKWDEKVTFVKENTIEPAIRNLSSSVEFFAIREVEYLLAYGNAFQQLPADDQWLGNIIQYIRQSSLRYMSRVNELRGDYLFVREAHKQMLQNIETERGKYTSVPCAMNSAPPEQGEPDGAGSDPLGIESLKSNDPSKPNPTKWCYWVKFSALATAVNVLPLPGAGGFKYWPIGLTIPNPSGLIKIPLPIIWIPIAVIPLQVGIFVIFIALAGICPSPVVFYMGPNGEKKFIISLRPGQEFGANAEKSILKLLTDLGIAVKIPSVVLVNDIKVPDFKAMLNLDGGSSLLEDVKDTIIKNIQKLPNLPDTSKLNAINPNAAIAEKRAALQKSILDHVDKMKVPDLKFPKNGKTVNPKLPPIKEVLGTLKKQFKLSLPQIAIPSVQKINLKTKLLGEIDKLKLNDISLEIPNIPNIPVVSADLAQYLDKVRDAIAKAVEKALSKVTPEVLGLVAEVAQTGIVFINPYKCKGTTKGLAIPPVPPAITIGLAAMAQISKTSIKSISTDDLLKLMGGKPVGPGSLGALIRGVVAKAIPDIEVPNPSKVSIKDMLKESMKMIVKMQLPSLPSVTVPPQPQVTVPGELLKGAVKKGVEAALAAVPIETVPFPTISPIDLKQMIVSVVEDSFAPVEQKIGPFLDIVSAFQAASDKGFPETLGLKPVKVDVSMVPIVTEQAMEAAMVILKGLSLVPYPAVAIAPPLFKKLHPVLTSDDLPPWERLTLSNFLFVCFLDEWCKQGKKTCGFFENP